MDSPVRIQLKKNDYLRHKFFRTLNRRKKRLLLQLIEAPEKELRRRLKLKRYEGGKSPMDYEYRGTVYDDELKNQGITHVAELPEVVVKGRDYTKPYESAFEYDPNFAKELPYFLPVVGDALDAVDVARDAYNGDYLSAGIGAGMLALPNFIEKSAKGVGKIIHRTAEWTPEQWNAAYRAAYKGGDKAEGQRLWDLWFRQQAKNNKLVGENNFPIKLRHNTDSEPWNKYDESYFNSATGDGGWYGKGLYASGNSWGEKAYGKNTMRLYGYMENPAIVPPVDIELNKLPENFTTQYIAQEFFNRGISKENYVKNLSGDALEWNKVYPELISKAIDNTEKADGIIVQKEAYGHLPFAPFDEVVLPKGTHIKSAEPFTLDDNGRLIDLTDRANFNINDIRYGLLPFGIGLAAYGTTNSNSGTTVYSKGKDSGIHIKPENRGKFNALKKRTGKTTEELTHSKNPLTRKRAIFALNARKWNHKK